MILAEKTLRKAIVEICLLIGLGKARDVVAAFQSADIGVQELQDAFQEMYDGVVAALLLIHGARMVCDGTYERLFKIRDCMIKVRIQRVLLDGDRRSHAILLDFMVPYRQRPVQDYCFALQPEEEREEAFCTPAGNTMDEDEARKCIREYKGSWKGLLEAHGIGCGCRIGDSRLARECIGRIGRQFMQARLMPGHEALFKNICE